MRKKNCLIALLILAFPLSMALASVPVQASPTTKFYVAMPPEGYFPGQAPGGFVQVDVMIETSENVLAWTFDLSWNPAALYLGYWVGFPPPGYWLYSLEGGFLSGWCTANSWTPGTTYLEGTIDQEAGIITATSCGVNSWTELPPELPGPTGTGVLVTFYFTTMSATEPSWINITKAEYGTKVATYNVDYTLPGFYNPPPGTTAFDALGMYNPASPIGSDWHELWPTYCQTYSMESFEDNGDGELSPSDQIDMDLSPGGEKFWYHVEWVNPTPVANDGKPDLIVIEKPVVPEFPLGSVAPIALIAVVAYIWWVTKRKTREAM